MNDDLYEYRFEQRDNEYMLRCWHNGSERTDRAYLYDMPEWLAAILATAKVGGFSRSIKCPPPDLILWFRTDRNHNLVEFIEMP